MKKQNRFVLGCFSIVVFAATYLMGAMAEQSLKVNSFGGMMEDVDPLALEEGYSQDSENVITDLGGGLQPRPGYIAYSTEPAKALWVFSKSDGARYIIAHSGDNLKADSGAKTFATLVSTVAPSIPTVGAQLGDYFYFSNTVDGLKRWNGTATTLVASTMTFTQLVTWKGRLVGAGKPSSERTLFISRYLDGTDWSLETDPTDDGPSQITVGGALDENISGMYASFKDLLMWFKNNSFGGLYGSRRSNFALRTFSESVGTNHPGTVRDCDGALRFLGPRRTVWQFDGTNITKISEGNNALFENILNGESNTRTETVTSKTDYEAGTIAGLSTVISYGDILLSTWTATDTTADDFGAGTMVNVTTVAIPGSVSLSTTVFDVSTLNNSFEDGTGTDADGWTEDSWERTSIGSPYSGSYHAVITFPVTGGTPPLYARARVGSSTGTVCGSVSVTPTSIYTQYTIPMSACAGEIVNVVFQNAKSIYSSSFTASGSNLTFYTKAAVSLIGSETYMFYNFIDLIDGDFALALHSTGSFTSQTFDTHLSSPTWLISTPTYTSNGHTLGFYTQTSTDSVTWNSAVAWTTTTFPTSSFDRYLRYRVDFTSTSASVDAPYVSDVVLSARQSSGTFVSDTKSIGTNITSWSVFQRDETLNDGTIVYGFYTDTDTTKTVGSNGLPVVGTFTSSQTITNNTIPTLSTAPYSFLSAKFDITASTQNPTNGRLSITWNEGSSTKAKGIWTNQRYWLATSLTNSTTNDTAFVYDRRNQWQKYTGFNVDDFLLYDQYPLFTNTSGTWQGEIGTSDNGSAISSSYTTKYYFPVGPETRAYLRELWMTTTRSDSHLNTYIYWDGVTTPGTLGSFVMNERQGYQVKKIPILTSNLQMVRHAAIKWAVSGTEAWKILNGSLYFDPDTQRE